MRNNTHYNDARENRPALVRGPDLQIRLHLDNQAQASLALAHEQRLSNLIALLSVKEFHLNRHEIINEIQDMTGIAAGNTAARD